MRKMICGLFLMVVAMFSSGCCTVPAKLVKDIEDTNAKILPKYLKYIEADTDPAHDAAWKDDEKKIVESLKAVVEALKKQVD